MSTLLGISFPGVARDALYGRLMEGATRADRPCGELTGCYGGFRTLRPLWRGQSTCTLRPWPRCLHARAIRSSPRFQEFAASL